MSSQAIKWCREVHTGKASRKAVLWALSWAHEGNTGRCRTTIPAISQFTELDRKAIMRAIAWLEAEGYVSIRKRLGAPNDYTLHLDKSSAQMGTGIAPGGSGKQCPKGDQSPNGDQCPIGDWSSAQLGTGVVPKRGLIKEQEQEKTKPNVQETDPAPPPQENKIEKNEPYLPAAKAMWDRIQPLTKQKRDPNFSTWANDLRLLVERDGQAPDEVWRVFTWANADPFWQVNILCPATLRKQFGRLVAKMNQAPGAGKHPPGSTRNQSLEKMLTDTSWATNTTPGTALASNGD